MKRNVFTIVAAALLLISVSQISAKEIVFNASDFIPAPNGYYFTGTDVVRLNVLTHFDKCTDEYGGKGYSLEAGYQNGLYYKNVTIQPDCPAKSTTPNVPNGFIQLTKAKYTDTDTAKFGWIATPRFSKLDSLSIEVSADATLKAANPQCFWVEYSKDNGLNWEWFGSKVFMTTNGKSGDKLSLAPGLDMAFDSMIYWAPKVNIRLRISSGYCATAPIATSLDTAIDPATNLPKVITGEGQYIKVHKLIVYGDSIAGPMVGVKKIRKAAVADVTVDQNVVSAGGEAIEVYNVAGVKTGRGKQVAVQQSGIYIVRTKSGAVKKVFVNKR